jgi:hypothetical protein
MDGRNPLSEAVELLGKVIRPSEDADGGSGKVHGNICTNLNQITLEAKNIWLAYRIPKAIMANRRTLGISPRANRRKKMVWSNIECISWKF